MPVSYTFTSFSFEDNNGFGISPQTVEPVVFAFGDYKRLRLNYSRDKAGAGNIVSEKIYFTPQLFGDLGNSSPDNPQKPFVSWFADIQAGVSAGSQPLTAMVAQNLPETGKNALVSWSFSGTVLSIYLDFYAASDLRAFLSGVAFQNTDRLSSLSEFAGANVYESAAQQIGTYLFCEYSENTGGLSSDGALKLYRLDGGAWPVGTTSIDISAASNPVFDGTWAVNGSFGEYLDLTGSGFPAVAEDFTAIVIYTAGTDIGSNTFRLESTDGTDTESKGVQTNALAYDDAGNTFTNASLTLKRGGNPVDKLSSIESTNLEFRIDSANAPTKVQFWYQDRNAATLDFPFWQEASFTDISGSITFEGGNTYVSASTLTPVAFAASNAIVAVWYDENNDVVNSFLYEPETTSEQDAPAYPDIQRSIYDYLNQYGDYLKAPVYERLKFSVFLDKGTYSARSIVGNFDDNFKRWELVIKVDGLDVKTIKSEFAASEGAAITETASNYNIEYIKRNELAWDGLEVVFQWYFYFDNGLQSDRIGLKQKVQVHSEAKNLTGLTVYDNSGFYLPANELENFCDDLNQTATVRTSSTGDNYKQIAVLVLPQIQEEESFLGSGQIPQSGGANLLNVDEFWAGGFAKSQFDLTMVTPDAIAVLSKEITETFSFGGGVTIEYLEQNSG